jgi:hypothetical protein
MQCYRLHTRPDEGGVDFVIFHQFFTAMQTTQTPVQHYTKIIYRFADDTQTEYCLHTKPIQTNTRPTDPVQIIECSERPGMYIYVYEAPSCAQNTPTKTKQLHKNSFNQVVETKLVESWTYTIPSVSSCYNLTKTATADTKEHASQARPRFDITLNSCEGGCVYDLFGRFADGEEVSLPLSYKPFVSKE